jgi:hypothetical protein
MKATAPSTAMIAQRLGFPSSATGAGAPGWDGIVLDMMLPFNFMGREAHKMSFFMGCQAHIC